MRHLALAMGGFGIVYGIAVGSYFGVAPMHPILERLALLDINDYEGMMRLSVFIGVGHMALANLSRAWFARRSTAALPPLGWSLVLLAGCLYWLLPELANFNIGLGVLGLLLVFTFSGETPVTSASSAAKRFFEGLISITDITKVFGDILSYLRLFALGLASASLAATFNQMAVQVSERFAALGIVLATLLLLLGHGLNFILVLVSGIVHGLRLNLIEFYNWSISQEGFPFQVFARKEIEPWKR
jgi:V/A-type H+-transporting ATPase subunit I